MCLHWQHPLPELAIALAVHAVPVAGFGITGCHWRQYFLPFYVL